MTRAEALNFAILTAHKFGLSEEVADTFNAFCDAAESRGEVVDYYKEANDALYEWDI